MLGTRTFRMLQLRRCAKAIAKRFGTKTEDGWVYDDSNLRIYAANDSTLIYSPIGGMERKLVYCFDLSEKQFFCRSGEWKSRFVRLYNQIKARS